MTFTDIFVTGSPGNARQAAQQAFEYNKFKVQWQSDFAGKATKGSKGMNIAVGVFAQYYEIDFQIMAANDGSVALRLIQSNSGWVGGVLGASKVKKQYAEIVDAVATCFESQGRYRGRDPG